MPLIVRGRSKPTPIVRDRHKLTIQRRKTVLKQNTKNQWEITITIIPILHGKGKHLFSEITREIELELISSKSNDFSFVQNKYKVRK